jgi:hypothetical protein
VSAKENEVVASARRTPLIETMWAEVVERFDGQGVEWLCSEEGGRDSHELRTLELAASTFPVGTRLSIREPQAPEEGDGTHPNQMGPWS